MKKFFSFVLAALLVFGFIGCTNTAAGTTGTDDPVTPEETPTVVEEVPTVNTVVSFWTSDDQSTLIVYDIDVKLYAAGTTAEEIESATPTAVYDNINSVDCQYYDDDGGLHSQTEISYILVSKDSNSNITLYLMGGIDEEYGQMGFDPNDSELNCISGEYRLKSDGTCVYKDDQTIKLTADELASGFLNCMTWDNSTVKSLVNTAIGDSVVNKLKECGFIDE